MMSLERVTQQHIRAGTPFAEDSCVKFNVVLLLLLTVLMLFC